MIDVMGEKDYEELQMTRIKTEDPYARDTLLSMKESITSVIESLEIKDKEILRLNDQIRYMNL